MQGGLATTKAMLTEQPELVTKVVRAMLKAIRLIKSDRKYGIEFIKGPWLDIGKDPEKIAARVYDIAGPRFWKMARSAKTFSAESSRTLRLESNPCNRCFRSKYSTLPRSQSQRDVEIVCCQIKQLSLLGVSVRVG